MCVCDEPNQKRAEQLLVAQLSECFLNLHVQIYVRLNTYFLIWKWVFKPKNFFINKGERTDQEEEKKGSSSNTKHSAKALLETHMDTPQPEDTLSDMIQLKYENPLFYLTWNTFLEVEAKPRQRGWLMVQLVHSHEFNASMWGE